MRRWAFVTLLLALTMVGFMMDVVESRRSPVRPLNCPEVVEVVEPEGDRVVCRNDPVLASCRNIRPGFRYLGCLEEGPMPGAVLLMHGMKLSASQASADDFAAIQGIGPGIASRIVSERTHGPFCRIEDLRRVPGIGVKRAKAIGPHLVFDDPLCAGRRAPVDSGRR